MSKSLKIWTHSCNHLYFVKYLQVYFYNFNFQDHLSFQLKILNLENLIFTFSSPFKRLLVYKNFKL